MVPLGGKCALILIDSTRGKRACHLPRARRKAGSAARVIASTVVASSSWNQLLRDFSSPSVVYFAAAPEGLLIYTEFRGGLFIPREDRRVSIER